MRGTYSIVTFGCQMNESDSESMAGMLEARGYGPANDPSSSDIIIVNSCAVRGKAEQKAYSYLGRYREYKQKNPDLIVGFAGCVAQKEGQKLLDRFDHLDFVLGPQNLTGLPHYLDTIRDQGQRILATEGKLEMVNSETPRTRREGSQAWVPIMTGCDKFCTFCIVPKTRGRERSRDPRDIIQEVAELVDQGYREITLLGQTVNSYGKTLPEGQNFPVLLRDLDKISGDFRFRFTSPHPMDTPPELVRCYEELDHLAPHIHLPVQSGSDRILRRMNRKYTREEYMEIIEQVRSIEPYVSISTDVIVGFPGETREDFDRTLDLFESVRFNSAFMFKYSPRSGTPAAKMEDQVPEDVVAERHQELLQVQETISGEINQRLVGETRRAFVEGESPKSTEEHPQYTGRLATDEVVVFDAPRDQDWTGKFVPVTIQEAGSFTLFGEPEYSQAKPREFKATTAV